MDQTSTPAIGPVLQGHRKARGLTLDELSDLSGVSKSMLSQVERGQANPTFAVLWSLTRALRIDLDDLVDGGAVRKANTIELMSARETPQIRSADGLCLIRILSPPDKVGSVEWYELDFEAGGVLDSSPHAAGAVEHFTALSAGFEITSGTASRTLDGGETARYPADIVHSIANRSKKRATGLLVVSYR